MRDDFDFDLCRGIDEEVLRTDPDNLLPGGLPQEATETITQDVTSEVLDHPADCNEYGASGDAAEDSTSFDDVALSLESLAPHVAMQASAAPSGGSAPQEMPRPAVSVPQLPLTATAARRLILPPLQNAPHRGPTMRLSKSSPAVLPSPLSSASAITYSVVPAESKASKQLTCSVRMQASWKKEGSEAFMQKFMDDTGTNSPADSITKVLLEHQLPRSKRCKGLVISFATAVLAMSGTASVALLPRVVAPCSEGTHETAQLNAASWLLLVLVLLVLTLVVSVMEHSTFLMEWSFGAWSGFAETFITYGKFLVFFGFGCHVNVLQPEDAYTTAVALTSRMCIIVHSVLSTCLAFYCGHISRSLPNVFAEDRPDRRRNVLSAQLLWFGAIAGTFGVGLRGLRYSTRSLNACVFGSVLAPMRLLAVALLDLPHLVLGCLVFIHSRELAPASEDRSFEEEQGVQSRIVDALAISTMLAAIAGLSFAFKTCRFDWGWFMYGSSYMQRFDFLAKKAKLLPRWKTMQRSLRKAKREARLKRERKEMDDNAEKNHSDSTPSAACQQEAYSA